MTPEEKARKECRGECCRNPLGVCRFKHECAHHKSDKPIKRYFNPNTPRLERGMRRTR